jgi:hypothetical protein
MEGTAVIRGMRPLLLSIMLASGTLYSHKLRIVLMFGARMANLMLRIGVFSRMP